MTTLINATVWIDNDGIAHAEATCLEFAGHPNLPVAGGDAVAHRHVICADCEPETPALATVTPLRRACDHRLGGAPDGLPCTNPNPHPGHGRGCTHESNSGSWVDDRHADGGHG